MFIDEKEFERKLGEAECKGVRRARDTLIYVHRYFANLEKDPIKKIWHEEQSKILDDDNRWNLLSHDKR